MACLELTHVKEGLLGAVASWSGGGTPEGIKYLPAPRVYVHRMYRFKAFFKWEGEVTAALKLHACLIVFVKCFFCTWVSVGYQCSLALSLTTSRSDTSTVSKHQCPGSSHMPGALSNHTIAHHCPSFTIRHRPPLQRSGVLPSPLKWITHFVRWRRIRIVV